MTESQWMFIGGLTVLSFAVFSCQAIWLRKSGVFLLILNSALFAWWLTNSITATVLAVAIWPALPWIEILTRIRRLRLPIERTFRPLRPPEVEMKPGLEEYSASLEAEGFEEVEDVGWKEDEEQQFFRIFRHDTRQCQAVLSICEQSKVAFFYVGFTSRTRDGRLWTTWTYPFSYGLRQRPGFVLNRVPGDLDCAEILQRHEQFLKKNEVKEEDLAPAPEEGLSDTMQNELRDQIRHNLSTGVLKDVGEGRMRYTWRGMIFLWCQFLRDIVRLS